MTLVKHITDGNSLTLVKLVIKIVLLNCERQTNATHHKKLKQQRITKMIAQNQFKVADSIATDDQGYALGVLSTVEFTEIADNETGEIKEQLHFIWQTTTRKGKETNLNLWTGLSINPIPSVKNGKKTYNQLTQLLLIHKIISFDDLNKIKLDESHLNNIEMDLAAMEGVTHKFKLSTSARGLSRPDISTLQIVKSLKLNSKDDQDTNSKDDQDTNSDDNK